MTAFEPVGRSAATIPAWRLEDPADHWPQLAADGPVSGVALSGGVWVTTRWTVEPARVSLPAMSSHVIALCHGGEADTGWAAKDRTARARLGRGVVSIIPAGTEGRWSLGGPVEVSHLYLPEARLQAVAVAAGVRGRPQLQFKLGVDDPHTAAILELLANHAVAGDVTSRMFAEQCVDLVCMQLIRTHTGVGATQAPPRRGLADWQLRRVAAYAQSRLDEAIALADLAGIVGLSRFHFCTAFRRATGQTPHDWLTGLRMDRATALLADPGLPITQIAFAVGYETPSSFTARFKRRTGLTPSQYRERLA